MASSSNQVKLVIGKDAISKYASYQSASLNHLNKYPKLIDALNYVLSYSLVSHVVSFFATTTFRVKETLIESPRTPGFVKVGYTQVASLLKKLDEVFNLFVLREGLDAFIEQYKIHDGSIGLWLGWFLVDYVANVSNLFIKEFIAKPLKLVKETPLTAAAGDNSSPKATNLDKELAHVQELTDTTKNLGLEIQSKLNSDYIQPTKEKLNSDYIQPTKEKLNGTKTLINGKYDELIKPKYDELIKPKYEAAKGTYEAAYQTVSEKYENNLGKTESVPRAVVITGVDLGNITLEKLKGAASAAEEETPSADSVASAAKEKVSQIATTVGEKAKALTT